MQNEMMKFDLPKDNSSIIKVIGVGGGGSNAVNHMYRMGIKGVDFMVCNTDQQALDISPVPCKIQLGSTLTEGRGAGSQPEVGRNAAIESIEDIKEVLGNNTKMVFVTAGMGGGTGTGAAPVIAGAAKEMGILTVAIVTIPFGLEGRKRRLQAEQGLEELKKNVDTLLIINNDKLREIYGNLRMTEAFGHADDVLSTAAKGIADIITTTLHINTDFADIQTVLKDSGVAIMGSASATGENRAINAVEQALSSPLLNDSNIKGANYVLLNITCGSDEITMDEFGEIADYIQEAAGQTAEVIQGFGVDESLGDRVNVTIIATGFNKKNDLGYDIVKKPEVKKYSLDDVIQPSSAAAEIVAPKSSGDTIVHKLEEEIKVTSNEREESIDQVSFEFEVSSSITEIKESIKEDDYVINAKPEEPTLLVKKVEEKFENAIPNDDRMRLANERVNRLKSLSHKFKTPQGLSEMESQPAYLRKNVTLSNVPHSSDSQVSRFTLSEGDDKSAEIKPNNSFLHDNVD
jgi:cell division protein FtsZ